MAWIDHVNQVTHDVFARAVPDTSQVFTFLSETASIPFRMGDPGELPLRFTLQLRSNRFRFPDGDQQVVTLTQPNQIVTFEATALASGQGTIQVVLRAPSGRAIRQTALTVRSRSVNRDRADRHGRRGARPDRSLVEEVVPTSDVIEPDPSQLPLGDERSTFVRDTAVMSVGTALSRITGYLRLSAQTAALGVSALGNTYATANTTPNIVYELVLGGILTSVFVPVFVEWLQKHGREEAWLVADRVLTLALVVLSVRRGARCDLRAADHPRSTCRRPTRPTRRRRSSSGAFFLRWFMPQIVFYGIGAVATGLLQAERKFAAPMFAPILNNLSVIATFGVYALLVGSGTPSVESITFAEKTVLAAGTTFGVAAMTLALWPSLRSLGFRWHLRFDWNHPAVRRLGKLALWVVVYVVANQLAYVAIIVFTGKFPDGYQVYASAFILFQLPHAIVAVSIFTALLPPMSARWAAHDVDGLRTLFSRGVRDTIVVIVPAALGYLALGDPDRQPAAAARPRRRGRCRAASRGRCRRSRWACRSSPRSNCSPGRSTRCRTRGRRRS